MPHTCSLFVSLKCILVLSLSHSSSNNFSLCAIIWLTLNLLIIASPQWQSKGWNAPASLEESITWWAMPTHVGGLSTTYIIKSVWSSLIKMLSVRTHSTLPTHAIYNTALLCILCMLCIQYYSMKMWILLFFCRLALCSLQELLETGQSRVPRPRQFGGTCCRESRRKTYKIMCRGQFVACVSWKPVHSTRGVFGTLAF